MSKIEINTEFILKKAKSFLNEYKAIPPLPPKMHMYTPRHGRVFLLCKDVAKFHKQVLDNFPNCIDVLDVECPTEEYINADMSGTAREHYIETTLHRIIDVFESMGVQEKIIFSEPKNFEQPKTIIENIFSKFHEVHKQLQIRRQNRSTITITDEYDVQDLLHAILRLFFDDIRPEEWNPSYANSSTKSDFFIPEHKIIIECKIRTSSNSDKEIKEQLIIDKEQYQHKCNILYCFVYDPKGLINNPRGFEKDIGENSKDFECNCYIVPRK